MLKECPKGLLELRTTLLQERVWLHAEGLRQGQLTDLSRVCVEGRERKSGEFSRSLET